MTEQEETRVSFNFGTTVAKASEVKRALEQQRDLELAGQPRDFPDDDSGREHATQAKTYRAEVEALTAVAVKGAEATIRALGGGYGRFQVSVSGHRNPDDVASVGVSVTAVP